MGGYSKGGVLRLLELLDVTAHVIGAQIGATYSRVDLPMALYVIRRVSFDCP